MADATTHAKSSARSWGGEWEEYIHIHQWFDSTKCSWADPRHRAVLHSTFGVGLALQVFGPVLVLKNGREVPVRMIGEQHVREDCGFIPQLSEWLQQLPMEPWMQRGARQFVRTFTLTEQADA